MNTIKNNFMEVSIDENGAELKSLKANGKEYLWCGDSKYWGRTAPVLFPIVGSVSNGAFVVEGQEYKMGQHGFARDSKFELVSADDTEITYVLKSNEQTLEKYPYAFNLYITYILEDNKLNVEWKVENTDDKPIHFSIGGHPAFMCPINDEGKQTDYSIVLKKNGNPVDKIKVGVLASGLLSDEEIELEAKAGMLPITKNLFDRDALIIEGEQLDEVSLADKNKNVYLTVKFETPLMGIWSPTGKNAPFVCIEPWYGRCDRVGFAKEFSEREYGNVLNVGEIFEGGFEVII